jgi:hypothetical protein
MLLFNRLQSSAQIGRDISLASAGRNPISKHLSAASKGPVGSVLSLAVFDFADYAQQLLGSDFRDGAIA